MKNPRSSVFVIVGLTFFILGHNILAQSPSRKPIPVFILAGQSNMQGQAVIDLDHPKYYNSGRGNLENVMKHSALKEMYKHLRNKDGEWVQRDDVFIRHRTKTGVKKGKLGVGFTGYDGHHHFGPEMQFGHIVGDYFVQPVLIIKTAWGGKSIYKDFRPPSSGGETGEYFGKMLGEIREGLAAAKSEFGLEESRLQIRGFVWFQGWNDMFDEKANSEYEKNLVNLILDLRHALKIPELPVVIGELGNDGEKVGEKMQAIRAAQASAAGSKKLGENVKFVSTTEFARPASESPNTTHGHHWYGNAESYFLIGDAFGNAMIALLENNR